jgi:glucose/arabinose dehydrogenase
VAAILATLDLFARRLAMRCYAPVIVAAALAASRAMAAAPSAGGERAAQVAQSLPEPFATKSVIKHPKVIPWPADKQPRAPEGFEVSALIRDIENPRWIYVLPNGDVLISQARTMPAPAASGEGKTAEEQRKAEEKKEGLKEPRTVTGDSPNKITLVRIKGDGAPEVHDAFLENLRQPFGMAVDGSQLFVACTDSVIVFPYRAGETKITSQGMKILDLPAGGYNNHWTRNILAKDGKLYISVGSGSNVAEHGTANEMLRANILLCNFDGTGLRVLASGLRNPVGMDWEPSTGTLWTAVNERDELGDELVPDYMTAVKDGGFYGWPYAYFGQHEDPRRQGERPDLVQKTLVPDVPLGSHTASLGLAFCKPRPSAPGAGDFPERYQGGAFIGQRGSWNRSEFVGYRVAFVPFANGQPAGPPEDFLTGFIANDDEVYGRPVGVAFTLAGDLLVADEPSNIVWRVSAK